MILSQIGTKYQEMQSMKLEQGIYYSVDWFTMMVHKASIFEVVDSIFQGKSITREDFEAAFAGKTYRQAAYGEQIAFKFHSSYINVPARDCMIMFPNGIGEMSYVDLFDVVWPEIRVDFSGERLDVLRSNDVDVETFFHDLKVNTDLDFKITRIDFAFDVIDYKPDFLDNFIAACRAYATDNIVPRVPVGRGAKKFEIKDGSQKTLYIGAGNGGARDILRVYDKKLEYLQKGKFEDQCPYGTPGDRPASWTRIEFQTRREYCEMLSVYLTRPLEILRNIYDMYGPHKQRNGVTKPVPDAFWDEFFDWQKIPQIIQNKNYKPKRALTPVEAGACSLARNFCTLFPFIQGRELNLITDIIDTYKDLQDPKKPWQHYRYNKIQNLLQDQYLMADDFIQNFHFDSFGVEVPSIHANDIFNFLRDLVYRQCLVDHTGHILSMDGLVRLLDVQISTYREAASKEASRA